jgi:uncharacterized membrane protein
MVNFLFLSNTAIDTFHELVFLEIFKVKRGCALCTNVHYTTLNTVLLFSGKFSSKMFLLKDFPKLISAIRI